MFLRRICDDSGGECIRKFCISLYLTTSYSDLFPIFRNKFVWVCGGGRVGRRGRRPLRKIKNINYYIAVRERQMEPGFGRFIQYILYF